MARFNSYLYLAMILSVSSTSMAQCPRTASGPQAVSLTISALQDTVTAGSPVFVKATVTNKSDQVFCIWAENDEDQGGWRYQADIHDAQGEIPAETKFGFYHDRHIDVSGSGGPDLDLRYLNGSGIAFPLKAGESLIDKVDVSRLYDLDEPGTYTIVLSLTGLPEVKSNPVTVTVVPAPAATSVPATEQGPGSPPFSMEIPTSGPERPNTPPTYAQRVRHAHGRHCHYEKYFHA